jgi:exosortase
MKTNAICADCAEAGTLAGVWRSIPVPFRWIGLVLPAALTSVLYAPVLARLAAAWWQDPNYSHGWLVPLFSGYVVWREREALGRLILRPAKLGMVVMLGAVALLAFGTLAVELFTSRVSLVFLLAGMVLLLAGWQTLRFLAFPLGFLLLAIPIPAIIQNHLVLPLQFVASSLAARVLEALGVVVFREGNLLHLANTTLEVAEACSGIRSLTSLIALAIVYNYLVRSRRWAQAALLALTLPIAVAGNALRVVGTGLASHTLGAEFADGFFHTFSGLFLFVTAFGLLLACHSLLQRLGGRIHA